MFLLIFSFAFSGKSGIQTHGTASRSPDFESGPFDHSGIFPLNPYKGNSFSFHYYKLIYFLLNKKRAITVELLPFGRKKTNSLFYYRKKLINSV